MSRKKATTMDKLIARRAEIDAQIAAAEVQEKRKSEILSMPEFTAILHLPVQEILTGLRKMVQNSVPQTKESGT